MNEYIKKANALYFSGKYKDTIDICNTALSLDIKKPWIYARKGLSHAKLEEWNDAEKFLKIAIDKFVRHPEILFQYARSIVASNENQALVFFKDALLANSKYIFYDWGLDDTKFLKKMLNVRLFEFYKSNNPKYSSLKKLLIKNDMNIYMKNKGFLVPDVYLELVIGDQLLLSNLPSRFVLKPVDGFNSNGVFVIEKGVDLFRREKIPENIGQYLVRKLGEKYLGKVMIVEELINDVDLDTDPYLKIPRDFKVFVANGKAYWVNVYNRNARRGLRSMTSYDPDWRKISEMTQSYLPGALEKKPKYFDEMIRQAEIISQEFPIFMRLDFYISSKGPVFGEFTPFPGDFINSTEFGLRTMTQMAKIYPDNYINK